MHQFLPCLKGEFYFYSALVPFAIALNNKWRGKNGSLIRVWAGPFPYFVLSTAEGAEV